MTLASILLVDADSNVRDRVASELRDLGHAVNETGDACSALKFVQRQRPDLMVCDFALPDLAGIELVNDVRSSEDLRTVRVLMTSNRNSADDVIRAFESGADDYIGKPIDLLELRARVGACLQRPASVGKARRLSAGSIVVDKVGHRVSVDGVFVSVTPREYRLLQFLMVNQDRVFSRKQLLVHVWDRDASVGPRTVDVHIRRLRGLLEPFGYDRYLQTVRGTGYRFSVNF